MNMTQIALQPAPRSTSACETQSSAPTAPAGAPRGLGRYPLAAGKRASSETPKG
jgi:hypothetical protein